MDSKGGNTIPGKKLILVIDDESSIRESLRELLELEGHDTLGASHGLDALSSLDTAARLPDLIFLDQMMPRMTGAEFLVELRKVPERANIPVVLISAARNAQAIAQAHGVRFLQKPLDARELLQVIERYA